MCSVGIAQCMESTRSQPRLGTPGSDETSRSAEKILSLVSDIGQILQSISEENCQEKDRIRGLLNLITTEAESVRDSWLTAVFIGPVDLFGSNQISDIIPDATGSFGKVIYRQYLGQNVAVKVNQKNNNFRKEIATLLTVSHDNIVSFRGWGRTEEHMYLVMEHVDQNLVTYVESHHSHENRGLPPKLTWDIASQLVQAMVYLHSRDVVHADLRPENVLIDAKTIVPKPKICDFGSSYKATDTTKEQPAGHIRWRPSSETLENNKKYDVVSFGLVVLYMKTGKCPYAKYTTGDLGDRDIRGSSTLSIHENNYLIRGIRFPALPDEMLTDLIVLCYGEEKERPFFSEIQQKYFKIGRENPYDNKQFGVFFQCGFLKNTYIYVADSVDETDGIDGCEPKGYCSQDVNCEVETGQTSKRLKPEEEDLRVAFVDNYREIKEQIKANLLNEHVAVALTSFALYQTQGSSQRRVTLKLKDINYSHHRAMRLVWRQMDSNKKKTFQYDPVNPIFSTSFGVHVAVLTDEGIGNAQKFVFAKRTEKKGRPSPGLFTCGAVRGCKADDYLTPEEKKSFSGLDESKTYLSLVKAAASGLEKELGLILNIEDWDAITFKTIYLKYDNHEWGIGGFINLQSSKVTEHHRYNFQSLKNLFSGGPKDKYENCELHGVDFNLDTMVDWIRKHHHEMASSAKIVAVKVMQERFGYSEVTNAFETMYCL